MKDNRIFSQVQNFKWNSLQRWRFSTAAWNNTGWGCGRNPVGPRICSTSCNQTLSCKNIKFRSWFPFFVYDILWISVFFIAFCNFIWSHCAIFCDILQVELTDNVQACRSKQKFISSLTWVPHNFTWSLRKWEKFCQEEKNASTEDGILRSR